jgi:ribosomal protein S6
VKKYEGLFILNTAGKEEGLKDILDRITADITALGGKVETVQKMEKRSFTRVADKKYSSGFYANVIFEIESGGLPQLRQRFVLNEDIFRVLFTTPRPPKKEPAVAQ